MASSTLLKKLKVLDDETLRRLRRRRQREEQFRREEEQFLFIDLRLCSSVLKTGKRLSRFYHTVVVTDRYALAAHEFWHRKTGGIWAEFMRVDDSDDSCSSDEDYVKRKKKHKEFLDKRDPRFEPTWARSRHVGTSGKLITLRYNDSGGPRFDGVGRAGFADITIVFSNQFQHLENSVDFEVREVSRGQFEVNVTNEKRTYRKKGKVTEMTSLFDELDKDKSGTLDRKEFAKIFELAAKKKLKSFDSDSDDEDDDPKWKWSKQLKQSMTTDEIQDWMILQTEIVGTDDAIGYVSISEIVNGHTGTSLSHSAKHSYNSREYQYTPRDNGATSPIAATSLGGTLNGSRRIVGTTARSRSVSFSNAPRGYRRPSRMT